MPVSTAHLVPLLLLRVAVQQLSASLVADFPGLKRGVGGGEGSWVGGGGRVNICACLVCFFGEEEGHDVCVCVCLLVH